MERSGLCAERRAMAAADKTKAASGPGATATTDADEAEEEDLASADDTMWDEVDESCVSRAAVPPPAISVAAALDESGSGGAKLRRRSVRRETAIDIKEKVLRKTVFSSLSTHFWRK